LNKNSQEYSDFHLKLNKLLTKLRPHHRIRDMKFSTSDAITSPSHEVETPFGKLVSWQSMWCAEQQYLIVTTVKNRLPHKWKRL